MYCHKLFAYGTLLYPQCIRGLLGRVPDSQAARLTGYVAKTVCAENYPGLLIRHRTTTRGRLYARLTPGELRKLDSYEGKDYRRVRLSVMTDDNRRSIAWVYVTRPAAQRRVTRQNWPIKGI